MLAGLIFAAINLYKIVTDLRRQLIYERFNREAKCRTSFPSHYGQNNTKRCHHNDEMTVGYDCIVVMYEFFFYFAV